MRDLKPLEERVSRIYPSKDKKYIPMIAVNRSALDERGSPFPDVSKSDFMKLSKSKLAFRASKSFKMVWKRSLERLDLI